MKSKNKDINTLAEENLLANSCYPSDWKLCIYKQFHVTSRHGQDRKTRVRRNRKYSGYVNQ